MTRLFIVAHAPLASAFRQVAGHAFGSLLAADPGRMEAFDVPADEDVDQLHARASTRLDAWIGRDAAGADARDEDVLLVTDVFGATPCNLARRLAESRGLRVLVGLNVPMLWRALHYRDRSADELAALAVAGATQGVMQVSANRPQNQAQKPPGDDSAIGHHQQ